MTPSTAPAANVADDQQNNGYEDDDENEVLELEQQ